MKKTIISLILALPFLIFASCSSEDNTLVSEPTNTLTIYHTVEVSGVTLLDGTFYTIEGMQVTIDGISFDTSNKDADSPSIQNTTYFLNLKEIKGKDYKKDPSFIAHEGSYKLNAAVAVRREDNTLTGMSVVIPLVVVKDASLLPIGAPEIGTYSKTVRVKK